MIRINRMHYPVTTLGPGRRLGIWVQGCSIGCTGCVSRDTWDPLASAAVDVREVIDRADHLCDGELDGVTISGGEPFDQPEGLAELLVALRDWLDRRSTSETDLLAYSGYELEVLQARGPQALAGLDAVIVGPYVVSRPSESAWWGSSNQRLVLLSEKARGRYANAASAAPQVQVEVDPSGSIWVIGVPRRGVLRDVEARLAGLGIRLLDVSWRP